MLPSLCSAFFMWFSGWGSRPSPPCCSCCCCSCCCFFSLVSLSDSCKNTQVTLHRLQLSPVSICLNKYCTTVRYINYPCVNPLVNSDKCSILPRVIRGQYLSAITDFPATGSLLEAQPTFSRCWLNPSQKISQLLLGHT